MVAAPCRIFVSAATCTWVTCMPLFLVLLDRWMQRMIVFTCPPIDVCCLQVRYVIGECFVSLDKEQAEERLQVCVMSDNQGAALSAMILL